MKLSICTISFNQRDFIGSCIESVATSRVLSNCNMIEHIVVDAQSVDGTSELLQSIDGIDHLIIENDKGPADGLNKAFSRASGEFGFFINADDCVLPGAISTMFRAIKKNPAVDVILMGGWIIDGQGNPIRKFTPEVVSIDGLLTSREVMFQPGMLFKLEIFRRIGGFNIHNKTCWDLELLTDMLKVGANVLVLPDRVGCFRSHTGSLSGGVAGNKHLEAYESDLDRLRTKYSIRFDDGLGSAEMQNLKRYLRRLICWFFWPWNVLQIKMAWRSDNEIG